MSLVEELTSLENRDKAKLAGRYFKANHDRFLGVSVPQVRKLAKQYFSQMNLLEIIA